MLCSKSNPHFRILKLWRGHISQMKTLKQIFGIKTNA